MAHEKDEDVLDLAQELGIPASKSASAKAKDSKEEDEEEEDEESDEEDVTGKKKSDRKSSKKDDSEDDEDEEEEEDEEEDEDEKSKSKKKEGDEDDSDDEEEDEEEDEKDDSDDEDEDEDEEEEPIDVDNFLSENYGKEYGIKSKAQLDELLEKYEGVADERDELKKKLEIAEKGEPKFKNDAQKKAFAFITDMGFDNPGEGLVEYATLMAMDVDKTDPKLILERAFILEHPELPADRARKRFEKEYNSKYVVREDDSKFEDEDGKLDRKKLQEAKEEAEDDLKMDAAKKAKLLKQKQSEFKAEVNKPKDETPEVSKEVKSAIKENQNAFREYADDLSSLTYEEDGVKVTYEFSKKQLTSINKLILESFLSNPANYDKNGQMKGEDFDPEELFQRAAKMLYADDIIAEALRSSKKTARIMKAEQIAEKKPNRKAKASGKVNEEPRSIDDAFELLAKKRMKQNARG